MLLKRIIVILIAVAGSSAAAAVLFFWYQIRIPLDRHGSSAPFKIESGMNASEIARRLEEGKIIKNAFYFRLYTILSLRQQSLKRGEYQLGSQFSIREIAEMIFEGKANEITVTIPEGLNLNEIENIFISYGLIGKGDLQKNIKLKFGIMDDRPSLATLEGYLFPDTYKFYKDSTLEDIAAKMVSNLDKKITSDILAEMKSNNKSFFQVLTVASLIEKEVKNDPDRQIVSGILWKRLKAELPLQVDATLIYITKRQEIYESDKKINSPYNTYMYRGLPKGPIANPGLEAILAAVRPISSSYWYYLSAPDGRTIYSETLEDHNRAKAVYLR